MGEREYGVEELALFAMVVPYIAIIVSRILIIKYAKFAHGPSVESNLGPK